MGFNRTGVAFLLLGLSAFFTLVFYFAGSQAERRAAPLRKEPQHEQRAKQRARDEADVLEEDLEQRLRAAEEDLRAARRERDAAAAETKRIQDETAALRAAYEKALEDASR